MEFDSFDLLEDEMLKNFPSSKQEAHVTPMKQKNVLNEDLAAIGTDSYDLEGSLEDVNKII
jgi:hypothetical protein